MDFRGPGLKTGVENYIFWSEIGSGFEEPEGIPRPRIPRSTALGFFSSSHKRTPATKGALLLVNQSI